MAATYKIDISQHKMFSSRFARAYADAGKKLGKALKSRVDKIFEQSQIFVPVGETGELKASGKVITSRENDKSSSYIIRYGEGESASYAYIVEMREFANSGKKVFHLPPTQAFYVADSHKMHVQQLKEDMAERVKQMRLDFKKM